MSAKRDGLPSTTRRHLKLAKAMGVPNLEIIEPKGQKVTYHLDATGEPKAADNPWDEVHDKGTHSQRV
ncbi:MAG: hypothetical protein HXY22_12355 [Alphaproteobacteria bacterium]|nr:hypothetical protein [Alphaproteobacteria bacterium]